MNTDFERLRERVIKDFSLPAASLHGPAHWCRVERNGLLLATRTGANKDIIRLFALFHDSRRESECYDRHHGARGAEYARQLHGNLFHLSDDDFEILHYACTCHTEGKHHDDPTIGTCWDADRLDLGRVCIIPSPEFMSTAFGREIAVTGSIWPYLTPEERESVM